MNERRLVCLDSMGSHKPPGATYCHGQKGNQVPPLTLVFMSMLINDKVHMDRKISLSD